MKKYRQINNITGWFVFAVAAFTYLFTIEPTASLWDCGEFIASGFKLEVGHPPGNPVFMVMARFFTLFAGGDVTKVAAMVNAMSALASAFTILFLFWTITHLARKIILRDEALFTTGRVIAVIASGIVGAVAFTFSDSFWFSAVEGEVYATSSLFTAVVFWAILKWEDVADEKYADRWIILIAFLMGLSIGVHLLNLLAIPAIVLVYYFRKFRFSWNGFLISLGASVVILALLMFGIMPGIVTISMKLDIFVNSIGLPANSGMIIHVVLLAAALITAVKLSFASSDPARITVFSVAALFLAGIWVVSGSAFLNILVLLAVAYIIWYLAANNRPVLNTALTAIAVILIGYSANAIIVIRSSANPPLNENNPSNPVNLLYFLNREQYGSRPLFKGPYYNAPITGYPKGKPKYSLVDGKYKITSHDLTYEYDPRFITFFPRMWSLQDEHKSVYESWGKVRGTPVQVTNQEGGKEVIRRPTFGENLRFMFSYQFGYMYFRYFMWNFSGRQNDTQGNGGSVNGNWITGISLLDEPRVGSSDDMPDQMKNDPSRNKYYLLPFILGIAGMVYQLNRDRKNWFNILLLFIMTGIAIVIYLNQYPNQPRERDYAYTGSFYFFSVWIGLGVLWVFDLLSRPLGEKAAGAAAGIICFAAVPLIMGLENWDDHDRSGRYLTTDVAADYLNSCAPDAILFSNGDNDTFPLWYAQEVEGIRTDVRVCNLMLLNTDWYVDQMKRATYESKPLPVTLPASKYYDGVNNQVYVYEKIKEPVNISSVIDWINSTDPRTKLQISPTEMIDMIPSRTIRIPVNAAKVLASGTVKQEDADKIVPYIDITLKGSSILKSQLIVLDILAHNDWTRPIYYVTGYHNDAFGLEEYLQLEGIAYRFVPIKSENKSWLEYGRIDTDILYENLINKFRWRSANDPDVYIDYNHTRTLMVIKARLQYARLAKALASEGKFEKAVEVLDFCLNALPLDKIPYDPYVGDVMEAYFISGGRDKAAEMARKLSDHYFELMAYYLRQDSYILNSAEFELQMAMNYTSKAADACLKYGEKELGEEISKRLEGFYADYVSKMKPVGR